jgi:hypothetical protein
MFLTQPSPNFRQNAAPNTIRTSFCCRPLNTKFGPNAHFFVLLHTSHYLSSSLPNVLSCYQPTFTRRTKGYFLGTFKAAKYRLPHYTSSASHCTISLPCFFFSLFHVFFNLLKPSGNLTYYQVEHSKILNVAHIVFMCFVWISEQTATFAL